MTRYSRFHCASSSLKLGGMLRKASQRVWPCLVLGVALHLSLSQIGGVQTELKVSKPLTTQFVKRQPRLTKPLELKKRPQPKRRRIQSKMVSVKARIDSKGATSRFQPTWMVGRLAQPRVAMSRATAFTDLSMEPTTLARKIQETKESAHKVDMSLEYLDIDALDTGRYRAMVIVDTEDKRNIRGS